MRNHLTDIASTFEKSFNVALIRSKNGKIQYTNSYGHGLFGFRSLNGKDRRSLFLAADKDEKLLLNQEEVSNLRVLFKKKDGQFFWGLLTSRVVKKKGEFVIDDMIMDVSSHVELEQELCQKNFLLDKASSELDQFIYSASHQIRGPLATVSGLVELLGKEGTENLTVLLPMIRQTISKLDFHIKKLVDFIKVKNEPLNKTEIDLKKFITNEINSLRCHPNFGRVRVHVENDVESVCVDSKKLSIVVGQVLKNAFDYIDPNKKRNLIRISISKKYEILQIEIFDNGVGVPKACLPKVFKMFYRGDARSEGSGLGLFIAQEATRNLHGSIQLQSEPSVGTVVKINLPV